MRSVSWRMSLLLAGQETYGEDPYLTGQMGISFVKGLQGDDPRYLKALATAKHYAVQDLSVLPRRASVSLRPWPELHPF